MSDTFAQHLAMLYACRACPNVFGEPVTGAVEGAKVMLVGQAPGPHEVEDRRPFAYTAGRRLFSWFEPFGIDEAQFRSRVHMCAVIRCFPGRNPKGGGDRVPHPLEIANCASHLDREVRLLQPKLMIAVGTLAAEQLIGQSELRSIVGRMHRAERSGVSFEVVVLPHPSGRSTWLNDRKNRALLERSLNLIATHPAWRATFRRKRRA
jgi:uracil-DNA glycosylase